MSTRPRATLAAAAALAVLAVVGWTGPGLLCLLPAALLLVALAAGWFPGERALVAALRRGAPRTRRRTARALAARLARPRSTGPRGGALLGSALAGRAPPSFAS